ncbi:ABC transporter substrate-binding protein [Actinocorallia populi]|uniref:ABC transporter substrate-binding protein n=1 Tax=Actinocorallia populi TaxID=2079200 RepID=UPI000D090619|nr:ABC transporter substrate-binding protein [Actinocorallia populi]
MGKFTTTAVTAAVGLMLSVGLAACGSEDSGSSDSSAPGFNAVEKGVVNPSDKKGGTIRYASSDDWDSPDMGDTYYAFSQNFGRLYSRALTTFKPGPGQESLEVVPDLAESLGTPSDGGKTWTYKIRKGVKFDDGTEVTSKDVKYAVERSNFTDELQLGPKYFKQYLVDNPGGYKGPYKDKSEEGLKSIETPDDHTIVFHLNQPFSEFDYLVLMQTQPVPRAKDNGLEYQKNIVSSGPYKIDSYERGKLMKLSRNPHWDKATDPYRTALPDNIEVALKQNADDLDQKLLSGALEMDIAGTGVQGAAQPTVLGDAKHKANADNITAGYLRYAAVNKHVKPLDDVHCRRAVAYATDKVAAQTAFGGPVAGGEIATTILPPSVTGYQKADRYPVGADQHGDLAKAKEELAACGQPNGFTTKISARSDRPKEVAAAQGIQQGLAKVGIKTEIVQVPAGDYFNKYAGTPKWVHDNNVGIMLMAWAADWPSGFGFLQQIVDGRAIKPSGGTNLQETDLPDVNRLLDEAIEDTDAAARNARYTKVDELVMEDAGIVPLIYARLLLYRPANVTNVTLTHGYGGMYDYLNLGVE